VTNNMEEKNREEKIRGIIRELCSEVFLEHDIRPSEEEIQEVVDPYLYVRGTPSEIAIRLIDLLKRGSGYDSLENDRLLYALSKLRELWCHPAPTAALPLTDSNSDKITTTITPDHGKSCASLLRAAKGVFRPKKAAK